MMIKINDILEGGIRVNTSGSAYLVSPDLPKDIYLHKSKTNKALHLDTVKIKVIDGKPNGRALEGEVIEVVQRFRTEFVGKIQISDKFAFFIPDTNKIPNVYSIDSRNYKRRKICRITNINSCC